MKKITYVFTILLLISIIVFCVLQIAPDITDSATQDREKEHIQQIIEQETEPDESFSKSAFQTLYEINSDLIGYLSFDSGIVSTPVVRGYNNEQYLKQSFEKQYSTQGTPFMDADATLTNTHFTIFGHNVYYNDDAMFSPLSTLVNQSVYEENKHFSLYTYEEQRTYVITNVLYFTDDENLDYNYTKTDFLNEDDFNEWISLPNRKNLINSGSESIRYGDKFITLQTCKRWDDHTIILLLAKELGRSSY